MARAAYLGTFDPLTFGHLDVIKRGSAIFEELVVAVGGKNVTKDPVFTEEERLDLLSKHTAQYDNVRVMLFNSLAVDFVRSQAINVILRGIRTISDFEYEFQMALTNRQLAQEVETVFVMPSLEYSFVSARLIREIVMYGGSVSAFVPSDIEAMLRAKHGF